MAYEKDCPFKNDYEYQDDFRDDNYEDDFKRDFHEGECDKKHHREKPDYPKSCCVREEYYPPKREYVWECQCRRKVYEPCMKITICSKFRSCDCNPCRCKCKQCCCKSKCC